MNSNFCFPMRIFRRNFRRVTVIALFWSTLKRLSKSRREKLAMATMSTTTAITRTKRKTVKTVRRSTVSTIIDASGKRPPKANMMRATARLTLGMTTAMPTSTRLLTRPNSACFSWAATATSGALLTIRGSFASTIGRGKRVGALDRTMAGGECSLTHDGAEPLVVAASHYHAGGDSAFNSVLDLAAVFGPPPRAGLPVGAIIGIVVGIVALLCIVCVVAVVLRRRAAGDADTETALDDGSAIVNFNYNSTAGLGNVHPLTDLTPDERRKMSLFEEKDTYEPGNSLRVEEDESRNQDFPFGEMSRSFC